MSYDYGPPAPPPPPYGQPYGQGPAGGPPPNNFLVPAILATIFCCLPLGIVAIVFAAQVNGKYNAGDYAGAQDAAGKARMFTFLSVGIGLVVSVIWAVVVISNGA